jgi:CxxC motif-containing protein (DUF1111 family)
VDPVDAHPSEDTHASIPHQCPGAHTRTPYARLQRGERSHPEPIRVLGVHGGPVVQQHATPAPEALGIFKEPNLPVATATGFREALLIFGLGLIDAVDDRTIIGLSRVRHFEAVHGHPAYMPDGTIGRFGRKATVSKLDDFNADAFFNEMGITKELNPTEGTIAGAPLPPGTDPAPDPELDAGSLQTASSFVKFLAPPAPLALTPDAKAGQQLFDRIKCTSCHVAVLQTGFSPIDALRFKRFGVYSDLLLHDLGWEDQDICNGDANPREFRTQPLMGMQFLDMFMHDGLSQTVEDAVQRHGGEASAARGWFFRLRPNERTAVVSFVMSL